jgi:DNA-binding transcriptional MerR regulator
MSTVSRLTGFSPELLRAWESRHHLLAPARGSGGQRLYSDEDLALLGRVRELLDAGHSIGEVAVRGRRALLTEAVPPPTEVAATTTPREENSERAGSLVQAMLRQARTELTLGWALDGSGESIAARSMHSASQAIARLAPRLDPVQVIDGIVDTLAADFDSALARIWVFEPRENVLYLRASAGLSRRTTTSSRARIELSRYRYKVGVVARTREPFVSNAIVGDLDFDQRWVKRERLASVAILPLTTAGNLQGILASFFRVAISEDSVGALGIFAATAASAIAAQRGGKRAERLSA